MLKHLPKDTFKKLEKKLLHSNTGIYYNDVEIDRRIHNSYGITTRGLNATQIATLQANYAKDLNIDHRISKFKEMLKNEHVYGVPLRYFTDLGKINFPTKIDYRIKLHLETEMKKIFNQGSSLCQELLFQHQMQR